MTIMTEMELLDKVIEKSEEKLDQIEARCRLHNMSDEEFRSLEVERKQLEQELQSHIKKRRNLRWENWKSMFVSVSVVGLVAVVFFMFSNDNSLSSNS